MNGALVRIRDTRTSIDAARFTIPTPYTMSCGCQLDCELIDNVRTMTIAACARGLDCKTVTSSIADALALNLTVEKTVEWT